MPSSGEDHLLEEASDDAQTEAYSVREYSGVRVYRAGEVRSMS